MTYRDRRSVETRKLFEGFAPDVSNSRTPNTVLEVCDLAASGMYSKEIAEVLGLSPKAVQKIFRRYDFPSLHNFAPPLQEERQNWSGGEKLMKGYIYVRTPGHPNGTKHGCYVARHRLVMEESLGRYLLLTEVVDHIDGDVTNNHPDNLRVFESNAAHLRETLKGRCPNWTEAGKTRLQEARSKPRQSWKGVAIERNP